jgi:hypothetical protein
MAEDNKEVPPDVEEKIRFLLNHEHPRAYLGHEEGNFTHFAEKLGIRKRETFRDQVYRYKKLPTDTQSLLAKKLGFRVDWDEWSTGNATAFKERYVKEVQLPTPKPPPEQTGAKRIGPLGSWHYAGIAAALGLAVFLVWWLRPNEAPYISHVRLFDESKSAVIPGSDANGARPRHTLTSLVERSGNDFQIETPEKFFFALGFVLHNLNVQSDGGMNATFAVDGLSNDDNGTAWHEEASLGDKDRWKSFDIAKTVGSDKVLQAFKLNEGQAIPIAVVFECMNWAAISRWSGEIQIKVQDLNGDKLTKPAKPPPMAGRKQEVRQLRE